MKLLADDICRSNDPKLRNIRDLLVKPEVNHSHQAPVAMVDRFVVMNARHVFHSWEVYDPLIRPLVKSPLPRCWVEWDVMALDGVKESNAKMGAFIEGDKAIVFGKLRSIPSTLREMVRFELGKDRFSPNYLFFADNLAYRDAAERACNQLEILLVAMCSNSAATIERVHPPSTRASRRMAQRGAPMYSHNIVSLILPQASTQRHETQRKEFQGTVREHWVRGHWRLIVSNPKAAYWRWIEGHKSGNPEVGSIVKTRMVESEHQVVRKGFIAPSHIGFRNERVYIKSPTT